MKTTYHDASRSSSVSRLSQAVQIQTISEPGNPEANKQEFKEFADFLRLAFPVMDEYRMDQPSNGLLWRIPGRSSNARPNLFLAHHDVVPVPKETRCHWYVPPFSGRLQGGFIWGRGTLDNKSNLLGLLEALTLLLESDWYPEKNIYLYSGADEEVLGINGARVIADWFEKQRLYFETVFDEGLIITTDQFEMFKSPVALIGIAEKGYLTVKLQATAENEGHSSMPTRHSTISRLAPSLDRLEKSAFKTELTALPWETVKALFAYTNWPFRLFIQNPLFCWIAQLMMQKSDASRAQLKTTVAVTRIAAGDRENALPAFAEAIVNLRIMQGLNTADVLHRVRNLIDKSIEVIPLRPGIEPSRISSQSSRAYENIAQSIKHIQPDAIIVPGLFTGHSDSIYFEGVAENIYRFSPMTLTRNDINSIHGINERISEENYDRMIKYYTFLIRKVSRL